MIIHLTTIVHQSIILPAIRFEAYSAQSTFKVSKSTYQEGPAMQVCSLSNWVRGDPALPTIYAPETCCYHSDISFLPPSLSAL